MLQVDVELPGFSTAAPSASAPVKTIAPPQVDLGTIADVPMDTWEEPEQYETYTVQQGDSLWSIAAKPAIYGNATHWRRIFDANRDLLSNPDSLKPGMSLRIPRGGAEEAEIGTSKK